MKKECNKDLVSDRDWIITEFQIMAINPSTKKFRMAIRTDHSTWLLGMFDTVNVVYFPFFPEKETFEIV